MLTTFPQCKFSLEFPEILSQNLMLSLTEFAWEFRNNALWDTCTIIQQDSDVGVLHGNLYFTFVFDPHLIYALFLQLLFIFVEF